MSEPVEATPRELIWSNPDEASRGRAVRAFYAFARVLVVAWCRVWFRVGVEGSQHVPADGPVILAPVHRSNIDTLLMGTVTSRPLRFMGKDGLWRVHRAASWLFTTLGGFPVNRGRADREALRRCEAVLALGQPLVMFPEGTRQFGPVVQPCFDGPAFLSLRTGAPIVPIGIGGSERAQRKGSKFIRPTKVHLVVGPPLVPPPRDGKATSRRAVRELTERLQREVQVLFDEAQIKAGAV
jgi:1-acyl-sn-glycerol-3-phosphate acyltransferase